MPTEKSKAAGNQRQSESQAVPNNRMVKSGQLRTSASTRDILGRDPKFRVMAGGTGKLVHLHD
jgi:hypothetical protein